MTEPSEPLTTDRRDDHRAGDPPSSADRKLVWSLFLSAALSSPGQTFVLALYVEPIMAALEVSRAAVSVWYTLATLAAAATLVPSGHLADRLSARRFLLLVMGAIAAGLAILATSVQPWQVLTGFLLLRLAGQGAIGVGLLTAIIRRFPYRSGRPLSLANLGYSAGEMVFPFLITSAIAMAGWRQSLAMMAVVYVTVAMPLLARGLSAPVNPALHGVAVGSVSGGAGNVLAAVRAPVFWVAVVAFSILPVAVTALFFHQIALFRLVGIDQSLVPFAFAMYALSHALGTAGLGPIIDAVSSRAAAGVSALGLLTALGTILVPLPAPIAVVAYSVLLGLSAALAGLAGALVWPRLFGASAVGRVRAVSSAVRNCATAAGPLLIIIPEGASVLGTLSPLFLVALAGVVAAVWLPGRSHENGRVRAGLPG